MPRLPQLGATLAALHTLMTGPSTIPTITPSAERVDPARTGVSHGVSRGASLRRVLPRAVFFVMTFAFGLVVMPGLICRREAPRWWNNDEAIHEELSRGVLSWINRPAGVGAKDFSTHAALFDEEWTFSTYFMVSMAMAQIYQYDRNREHLTIMDRTIEKMTSEKMRAFDAKSWGSDPIADTLTDKPGHVAYLSYLNLALSLHRCLEKSSRWASLNDQISAYLVRHIVNSPIHLLPTYPNTAFPADNASVFGSIGVRNRCVNDGLFEQLSAIRKDFLARYTAAGTGLLIQSVDPVSGSMIDGARGSGTAFAIFLSAHGDAEFAAPLAKALRSKLSRELAGFGTVREYPQGVDGHGDIDSGPVVFGASVAATGFSLAAARWLDDERWFTRLYCTTHLFGAPWTAQNIRRFSMGGPLGDSIMLAMLTFPKQSEQRAKHLCHDALVLPQWS